MKPQKTVILTDSKATLQSLTSNTPDQPIHQLLKDLQQIAWLSLRANNRNLCPPPLTRKPKPCSEIAKNANGKEPLETTTSTDPINRLAKHEQTTIFRLRTGHCGLRAHLKRTGIMDSALCDCKEAEQTIHHILQDFPSGGNRDTSNDRRMSQPPSCGERRKTCAAPPKSWQNVD